MQLSLEVFALSSKFVTHVERLSAEATFRRLHYNRVPRAFCDIYGKRNLPGKIDKRISK